MWFIKQDTNPSSTSMYGSVLLKEGVKNQVAAHLAHALCLADGFSTKRCKRITKGVQDEQLGKWLEATPEATTQLFPNNVGPAMRVSLDLARRFPAHHG